MAFNPTDEQRAILAHDLRRHARLLAGPGTGKSATLITLLNTIPGEPSIRTKLVTFTRAATAELAHKLSEQVSIACERPSTVHSFCIAVLIGNPGVGEFPRPFRMADDWENKELVRPSISRRLKITVSQVRELFAELASNWESLDPQVSKDIDSATRARFMGGWRQHREIYGYTLVAELPHALLTALQQHGDLDGIDYNILIVDEYQDLNACDLAVLNELASRGCKLIGAGDDDQSIYSFRKAHPEGIRRFLMEYDGAADYPLSITQRCGKRIVAWANFVIQGDPDRPQDKVALRSAAGASEGEVALLSFVGHAAEAKGIAALVAKLINAKEVPPSEVLILMRSDHNGQVSKRIKQELTARGIPFSDPETVNEILNADSARKAISLARLAVNREDSLAWATLLHFVPGLGDVFEDYIYKRARDERTTFAEALLQAYEAGFPEAPRSAARATPVIKKTLEWLNAHPVPAEAPENGWAEWIEANFDGRKDFQISDEFRSLLSEVNKRIDDARDLDRYLGQVGPTAKDIAMAKSEGVRIMTLAASKGLTVEAAILTGLETGWIPKDGEDLAEERRLLYVGMTRAGKYLYGTWAQIRRGPTGRAGRGNIYERRRVSIFLDNGPVRSQNGNRYLQQE
jgi:DNA helicase-2/ATP-dependent DNA helicase PcrA